MIFIMTFGREQNRSASPGLGGDQQVIGPSRGSCRFERYGPITGSRAILFAERNDINFDNAMPPLVSRK